MSEQEPRENGNGLASPAGTPRRGRDRQPPHPPPATSPYRRPLPRNLEVEPDPLRLRLDFHRESIVRYSYSERGRLTKVQLLSAFDVTAALAGLRDLSTPVLPPETLWWTMTAGGTRLALWRAPQVWTVRLRETYDGRPRRLRLPMPGLVFLCLPGRQAPYVFAARERPVGDNDQLYHCPCFNVFESGRVCVGSHLFPADPGKVPEAFFSSYFSVTRDTAGNKSRRYPEDIGALWHELDGRAHYPTDDLVPHLTVADAKRIGA